MAEYTLRSSFYGHPPQVNAHSIVEHAINAYMFADTSQRLNIVNVVASTWDIPAEAAEALVSRSVGYNWFYDQNRFDQVVFNVED